MSEGNKKDAVAPESKAQDTKKTSKGKKTALITVAVIVGLLLLLVAAFFILRAIGKSSMTSDGSSVDFECRRCGAYRRRLCPLQRKAV